MPHFMLKLQVDSGIPAIFCNSFNLKIRMYDKPTCFLHDCTVNKLAPELNWNNSSGYYMGKWALIRLLYRLRDILGN